MARRVRSRDARSRVGVGFRVPGSRSTCFVSRFSICVGFASSGSFWSRALIVFIVLVEPSPCFRVVFWYPFLLRLIFAEHFTKTIDETHLAVRTNAMKSVGIDRVDYKARIFGRLNIPRRQSARMRVRVKRPIASAGFSANVILPPPSSRPGVFTGAV